MVSAVGTPSALVRSRLALMIPAAEHLAGRLCEHDRVDAIYPELLCLLHHTIRASVPLLETAEQRAAALAHDDPVAAGLVPYLREHAVEERHHDAWLLDDVAALGRDPHEITTRVPSPTIAAMVGAVYYWTLHYHPVAILGYLAVMEGTPPSVGLVDELQARSGHPADAFRTLRHHADVDPHHRAALWRLLDRLPLDPGQLEVVGTTAMHSLDLFVAAEQEILDGW